MKITKMQGNGNDFLLINGLLDPVDVGKRKQLAKDLCRRRYSFGADGMIFLEPSDELAFRMEFYNADGSLGEMCGNGARCLARFAYEENVAGDEMSFETSAGRIGAKRIEANYYSLSMQLPSLYEERIVEYQGKKLRGAYLELGNPGVPHFCLEVQDIPEEEDLRDLAKYLRHHPSFPKGTNVNLYHLGDSIHTLTYERGVEDYTLACGSGVSCVAYHLNQRNLTYGDCFSFVVPGGDLRVEFVGKNPIKELILYGFVEKIYEADYAF